MGEHSKEAKFLLGLDLVRVIACLAVLLYHMRILPGGYLAVCVFFVLSGYLAVRSALSKDKFSLLQHYKNRFLRLYVPVALVVFVTVLAVTCFPQINWLYMKPEAGSVLLGWNNIWQLQQAQDYFAQDALSPFVHMWYIAIQFQFELVFPLLFLLLVQAGKKATQSPLIITGILAGVTTAWFGYMAFTSGDVLRVYYGTDTRVFSLLIGVFLGYLETGRELTVKNFQTKNGSSGVLCVYLALLVALFILISDSSRFYALAMVVASLATCRCISYSRHMGSAPKAPHIAAGLSYAVYLVQYPVIFLGENTAAAQWPPVLLFCAEIAVILVAALLLKGATDFIARPKPMDKTRVLPIAACAVMVVACGFGVYRFVLAEDHTQEMEELAAQLEVNAAAMEERQAAYAANVQAQEADFESQMAAIEEAKADVPTAVANLPVVAIGDSVMLGAMDAFLEQFPNCYFDALKNRTPYELPAILNDLADRGLINGPVVIGLGNNGDVDNGYREEILSVCGDVPIFWITNVEYEPANDNIRAYAETHDNFYIIDWQSYSAGHTDWFWPDQIHLPPDGAPHYVQCIYERMCDVYVDIFDQQAADLQAQHDNAYLQTVGFYGNDLFVGAAEPLSAAFPDASFSLGVDYNYGTLLDELAREADAGSLPYNVVIGFDTRQDPIATQLDKLATFSESHHLYVCAADDRAFELLSGYEGITVIDLRSSLFGNEEFVFADRAHLNDAGNVALVEQLTTALSA